MRGKRRRPFGLLAAGVLGAAALAARADDAPAIISDQGGALQRASSAAALAPPMPSVPPGASTPIVPSPPAPAPAAPAPVPGNEALAEREGRAFEAAPPSLPEKAAPPPVPPAAAAPAPEDSRKADESRRTALTALLCVGAAFALAAALKRRV